MEMPVYGPKNHGHTIREVMIEGNEGRGRRSRTQASLDIKDIFFKRR